MMDGEAAMRRVIALAREGSEAGHGGPFGCVILRDGDVVAEAHNEVISSRDPTAHAELLAIRRASAALGTPDLSDCDLYTIGAPCCMCMSSMFWARIRKTFYVLPMADSAAIGLGDDHLYRELARPLDEREIIPMVHLPAQTEQARDVYRGWFNKPGRIDF